MILYREALDRLCVRLNMYLVTCYFSVTIVVVTLWCLPSNRHNNCIIDKNCNHFI